MSDHPIIAAWGSLSQRLERWLHLEKPEESLDAAAQDILAFLRRSDVAELTDESLAQLLEFVDTVADMFLILARDRKNYLALSHAISVLSECHRLLAGRGRNSSGYAYRLGGALRTRYRITKDQSDLDGALRMLDEAVRMFPMDARERPIAIMLRGVAFGDRAAALGSFDDLIRSVELLTDALAERPAIDPHLTVLLDRLGGELADLTVNENSFDRVARLWARALGLLPFCSDEQVALAQRFRQASADRAAARQSSSRSLVEPHAGVVAVDNSVPKAVPTLDNPSDEVRAATIQSDTSETQIVNPARGGEAELRRYMELPDADVLDRAIEQLRNEAKHSGTSDDADIRSLLHLAGALAMRFQNKRDPADFSAAMFWNQRALASNPDDATKVQAFFNIGALQFEEYKRSPELKVLEAAIDNFTQSLQASGHEHPLRQLLIGGLQAMLFELTLKVPNPVDTGDRWQRAIYAVPFRSLDQRALTAAWHSAFSNRMNVDDDPSLRRPSFLDTNRAGLRQHANANEVTNVLAIVSKAQTVDVDSYGDLTEKIEETRRRFPGALLVFRGQTEFHDGRLAPSMARTTAQDGDETHRLWIAAVGENLRYGDPDPLQELHHDIEAVGGVALRAQTHDTSWTEIDPTGPEIQAILQHYGARTRFVDVSRSLDVALWFAHFRFRMRHDIVEREELAKRGARWAEDDPVPEYDIAWYEPAWTGTKPAIGYLFVLAPRLPQSGDDLNHGEYIDLAACPSARMKAQHAGLVYSDPQCADQGTGTVAVIRFRVPLAGAPAPVLDPSVRRLFPAPDEDALYGRILWSTPFWPEAERPTVQVRRLRIPEYHPAPATRPDITSWGEWLPFRARDLYTRPAFVFSRLATPPGAVTWVLADREVLLSDALPLVPTVPSMMIDVAVPESGVQLRALGRDELFLEYDPLSRSLSTRAAAHHVTAQIDRRQGFLGSWVPLAGVRGAWLIQVGDTYWCRVYTESENGELKGTAGHAFVFDPQFGWVVKGGPGTSDYETTVAWHAERAAFYLVAGIAEQVVAGTWRTSLTAGSPYVRLDRMPQ